MRQLRARMSELRAPIGSEEPLLRLASTCGIELAALNSL